jgi:hypothetical protein
MAQLVWALVRKFPAATSSSLAACDYPAPVLQRAGYMHAAATVNELCRELCSAAVCVHCITIACGLPLPIISAVVAAYADALVSTLGRWQRVLLPVRHIFKISAVDRLVVR